MLAIQLPAGVEEEPAQRQPAFRVPFGQLSRLGIIRPMSRSAYTTPCASNHAFAFLHVEHFRVLDEQHFLHDELLPLGGSPLRFALHSVAGRHRTAQPSTSGNAIQADSATSSKCRIQPGGPSAWDVPVCKGVWGKGVSKRKGPLRIFGCRPATRWAAGCGTRGPAGRASAKKLARQGRPGQAARPSPDETA